MNFPEENGLTPEPAPKKDLMQSAKDFMSGMLAPLKGKDVGQLVENFTAEMTLVAEGLSEDQRRLQQENARLNAQLTELEQTMLDKLHDADAAAKEMRKEIASLQTRLEKAEKAAADKKLKKAEGLTGILRQATWLVAIPVGAWIITTLINLLN